MPPKSSQTQTQPSISSYFSKPATQKRTASESDGHPGSSSPLNGNAAGGSSSRSARGVVDLTDSPPRKKARIDGPATLSDEIEIDDDDEDANMDGGESSRTGSRAVGGGSGGPVTSSFFASRLTGSGSRPPSSSSSAAQASRAAAIRSALTPPTSSRSTPSHPPRKTHPSLNKYSLPPQSVGPISSGVAFPSFSVSQLPTSISEEESAPTSPKTTESDDPPLSQIDQAKAKRRHDEWQKRLVQPGGLVPRRRSLALDEAAASAARAMLGGEDGEVMVTGEALEGGDGDIEMLDEPVAVKPTTKGKGKKKVEVGPSGLPYTPLEKQYMEIKEANQDVLLLMEVGYKFKFHGDDAKIASKELGIACFPNRNFYSASIPVHRLHVHVKKLVAQGHKVGVVRQTETAALKAAGDNRSKPFERKLTNLYTAATYVDDSSVGDGNMGDDFFSGVGKSHAFVGLSERNFGGMGTDERVEISMVSVDCSSGVVVYDTVVDGHLRSELETRLAHLQPSEILLPETPMSKPTEKMLAHFAGYSRTTSGSRIRVERAPFTTKYDKAFDELADKIARMHAKAGGKGKGKESDTDEVVDLASDDEDDKVEASGANAREKNGNGNGHGESNKHLEALAELEKPLLSVLAAMVKYLKRFKLEAPLLHVADFGLFSAVAHMIMSANTLTNLEIFKNQTDFTEKGSLLSLVDHTRTKMGRRVLREWLGRPLTDIRLLQRRVDAVEEILNESTVTLEKLKGLLKNMPDLQRGLCRIQYHKATPGEVATLLIAFQRLGNEFNDETSMPKSELLREIVQALPRIKQTADRLLSDIKVREARTDVAANMFADPDKFPAIQDAKDVISICEHELDEHLKDLRKSLRKPSLAYVTVSGIDFLIEMRLKEVVPLQWAKISATKHVARYHTPVVLLKLKELEQGRETLQAAGNAAFLEWQSEISEQYDLLRDAVVKLATFDCLFSLAKLAASADYVKPVFVEGNELVLKGARHPMAETFSDVDYVPNDISFTEGGKRVAILTGPNMSGKSTAVRAAALILVLAQMGSFVPAGYARLGMHDAIFTRMGAMDRLAQGQSTFMVEMVETSEILRQATKRSLCLIDELGRGTSTHDGMAVAYGVLDQLTTIGCSTLFTTHFPVVAAEMEKLYPKTIGNYHMSFEEMEGSDGLPEIVFLYKLIPGLATRSFGVWVGRLAGLPMSVLMSAQRLGEDYRNRLPKGNVVTKVKSLAHAAGLLGHDEERLLKALKSS